MKFLVLNRWQSVDGTILESKHRHDCVFHTDGVTGETCMVDGGIGGYIRLSGTLKDMCVYSDSSHEEQRDAFKWGSRGKNGDEELSYIALKDLSTDHIGNIIRTQKQIQDYVLELLQKELEYRKVTEV